MGDGPIVLSGPWGFFVLFGWAIIGFAAYVIISRFVGRSGQEISRTTERRLAYKSWGIGILVWALIGGVYGGSEYFWSNVSASFIFLAVLASFAGLVTLGDRVFVTLSPGMKSIVRVLLAALTVLVLYYWGSLVNG